MRYVRLVKHTWFEHKNPDQEFNDLSFKRSTDDTGMSIFKLECVVDDGRSIAEHVAEYYAEFIVDDEIVFCVLDEADLPPHYALEVLKDEPDPHHLALDMKDKDGKMVGNKALKRHFRQKRGLDNFSICDGDAYRPVSADDVARWAAKRSDG